MIESAQNEKIKYVTKLLTDNRFRKKSELFVVEGRQENERALQFGYFLQELYISPEIYKEKMPETKTHFISAKLYNTLAYRADVEGIIGVYNIKKTQLATLKTKPDSSVIIVEGVEKPGNLGAILRSCEAFGISAVIITESKVDLYNPNVVRSSVGCLFGMHLFSVSNAEALEFLTINDFKLYTTIMDHNAVEITKKNLKQKTAIAFGTEHSGLSEYWHDKGENIIIPMVGTIDSLNLSNAVAISCYEIVRQKSK